MDATTFPSAALMLERRAARLLARTEAEDTMALILSLRKGRCIPEFILSGVMVDYAIPERLLLVEVDGASHRGKEAKDARRDAWLRSFGFNVIRFTNRRTNRRPNAVDKAIRAFHRSRANRSRFDTLCETFRKRIDGRILFDDDDNMIGIGRS